MKKLIYIVSILVAILITYLVKDHVDQKKITNIELKNKQLYLENEIYKKYYNVSELLFINISQEYKYWESNNKLYQEKYKIIKQLSNK